MNTELSVIIPVYNAEKYLEECLNSIISSSAFDELEVLLIDDGSKDNSGAICDIFSQKYENIKTFHIENGGVSNARNFGVAKACGEYVTFCDADDYYINDILSEIIKLLKANEIDLLFYDLLYELSNVSRISYPFKKRVKIFELEELFIFMIKNEHFNSSCNKIFKTDVLKQARIIFTPGQKHGEDRDFVLRYLSVCKTAYYLPEAGYFYRYVKNSAVNKKRTDYFDNIYHEIDFKLIIASKFDINFSEAEKLIIENAVNRIISNTFAASENGEKSFSVSLKSLYENKKLFGILCEYKNIVFYNSAYKKVADFLCSKKTLRCWYYIRFLKLKEHIYKLIKG